MRVKTTFRGIINKYHTNELTNNEVLQQCRILTGHNPITGKKLIKSGLYDETTNKR